MLFAKKGDKFSCPSCKIELYEFVRDIKYGDRRDADCLIGINGFSSPIQGAQATCPNCGEYLW